MESLDRFSNILFYNQLLTETDSIEKQPSLDDNKHIEITSLANKQLTKNLNENNLVYSSFETPLDKSKEEIKIGFKIADDLEKDVNTSVQKCASNFIEKGGTLQCITSLEELSEPQIRLNVGDAVYPICSVGVCRSQTLWALLRPYSNQINLFPPHGARQGWDPYNGKINLSTQKAVDDKFDEYFGIEKSIRFGFENEKEWKLIKDEPEGLEKIRQYFDQFYYGPKSTEEGKRRIYIAFSHNAHVVLYRLNQTNDNLKNVTLIAIESEDLITRPPEKLETASRSMKAYEHFSGLLVKSLDLTGL